MDYPYRRPQGEYTGDDPQGGKYQNDRLAGVPISSVKLDGDLNKLGDAVTDLKSQIDDLQVAGLTGADSPENVGNFPTTNGDEIIWTKVTNDYLQDRAVSFTTIQEGPSGALTVFNADRTLSELEAGAINTVLTSSGPLSVPQYKSLPSLLSLDANTQNKLLISTGLTTTWGFLTNDQVADNAISGAKITDASLVGSTKLQDLSVSTAKLASKSVTEDKIPDAAVSNIKLATGIDGAKLTNRTVSLAKLTASNAAYGVITNEGGVVNALSGTTAPGYFLRTEGVSGLTRYGRILSAHLDAGIIGETQLAANAVTTAKIKDSNVTTAKIADLGVTDTKINTMTLTKLRGGVPNSIIITGSDNKGTTIPMAQSANKVLCSKTSAPYGEFRALTQSDVPQLGMQPVYVANFNANGTTVNGYNPFNIVTGFSWVSASTYYQITLTDQAVKFVVVGTPLTDSPYVMNFKIILKTGIYVRFSFSQQVGDSVSTVQSPGSIILYKVA